MKAILCDEWGGPETLRVGESPEPRAGAGELVVAPRAWGVNFADLVLMGGNYYLKPPFPFIPGMEVAGEVVSVGPRCDAFRPGCRVACYVESGGYAERVVAQASATMRLPAEMPIEVAAAFPATYGTALVALRHRARLRRGETLLVLGAAGGVGLTAVAVGKQLGASVIAAASSKEKLAVAAAHGADHLVDYQADDLVGRVRELTGEGADVVFDPVGGDQFDNAMRCIAFEGRLVVIGFTSGRIPSVSAGRILIKGCSVVGSSWTAIWQRHPAIVRRAFNDLARWYTAGVLRPEIDRVLPFDQAADALRLLAERKVAGKIVLTMDGRDLTRASSTPHQARSS